MSLSEPHTSELNGGFFIHIHIHAYKSVIHIPYVYLDCNLMQQHAVCGHKQPFHSVNIYILPKQTVWAKRDAWEEKLVNLYCTTAGSCKDKPGYLEKGTEIL